MEVELTNFKCWSTRTLNISSEGVTLIHGRSGKGKSSILEAIAFAITGKGKNIIKAGKKSCSVTLRLVDGICITRRKRPNILTVQIPGGDKLEDDAAQGYIDQRFTSTFDIVAYLRQSGKSTSFVTLSPREKLIFLEELAFHGYDITKLKSSAHDVHRENTQKLVSASAKIEILNNQLDEMPELKPVKCPVKTTKGVKISQYQEKLRAKEQQLKEKKKSLSKKIEMKMEELAQVIETETKLDSFQENLVEAEEELASLTAKDFVDRTDEIDATAGLVHLIVSHTTLNKKKIKLEQLSVERTKMEEEELASMQNSLTKIESALWDQGKKKEALGEIADREAELLLIKKREEIQNKLQSMTSIQGFESQKKLLEETEQAYSQLSEKTRAAVDSSQVHTCPECNTELRLCQSKLVKLNDSTVLDKNEILQCKKASADMLAELRFKRKKVAKLEAQKDARIELEKQLKKTPKVEETANNLQEEIDDWKEYIRDNKRSQKEIESLKLKIASRQFSDTHKRVTRDYDRLSTEIVELEDQIDPDLISQVTTDNIDDLRESLAAMRREQDLFTANKALSSRKRKKIEILRKKIQDLGTSENTSDEIKNDLDISRTESKKISSKIAKIESLRVRLQSYASYINDKGCAKSLNKKLKEIGQEEAVYQTFTQSAEKLRSKIKEAESKCLESFVWSLQSAVQLYLDEFFPHDPITISISRFKTTKSKKQTKPEIHITFSYKGQEFDYQSLSGGELQRVVLAFTLALVEKFDAPFVMLDESTSNLDQDLTNLIVSTIRKYHSARPVILVAHQVVTGVFENMIEI